MPYALPFSLDIGSQNAPLTKAEYDTIVDWCCANFTSAAWQCNTDQVDGCAGPPTLSYYLDDQTWWGVILSDRESDIAVLREHLKT